MLLPALNAAREKARRISCASNEKQVGLALQMFVNYPDEPNFPNALKDLVTRGTLTDTKMFICPSTTLTAATYDSTNADSFKFTEDTLSYQYLLEATGKGLNSSRCSSDSGIYYDHAWKADSTPNHENFSNVLYGDGHVGSKTKSPLSPTDDIGWATADDCVVDTVESGS